MRGRRRDPTKRWRPPVRLRDIDMREYMRIWQRRARGGLETYGLANMLRHQRGLIRGSGS